MYNKRDTRSSTTYYLIYLLQLFLHRDTIIFFLSARAGGIPRIQQSDWFRERAGFSCLLTMVTVTFFVGNLEVKSFYTGTTKECVFLLLK